MLGRDATTILEMKGLVKRFGRFTAIDHVDFQVEDGEVSSLPGENGASKTTTIEILASFQRPDDESVRVF